MASPPERSEEPSVPPSPGQGTEPTSPSSSTDTPQLSQTREKKRVGFASDLQPHGAIPASSPAHSPEGSRNIVQDYFAYSRLPYTADSTPADRATQPSSSFDSEELVAALSKILDPEDPTTGSGPSKPRPVLRKSAPLKNPVEPATTPLRSELEAKNRADRLAYSIGAASVPVSARTSLDSMNEVAVDGGVLSQQSTATPTHPRLAESGDINDLRSQKRTRLEADQFVKSHLRRKSPLSRSIVPSLPETATPLEDDMDYVPPPEKYRGGILGTLLKLYTSDTDKFGSTYTDTSASSTPASTPPHSRSGTPRPEFRRPRPWRNQSSSSTLAGLVESSFMFAAPGSGKDMSEKVKKVKKSVKSKKKDEEYRVKIHIAEIIKRHTYLITLCKALMSYGAPTHRLEAYMRMSARVLEIEGQFLYLPDTMIISFDDSNTHTTEVKIVRAPQGLDFGRLRDVHEIYKDVVHDRIGVEEATVRLQEVIDRKPEFSVWLRILLYGVASALVAPFGFEGRPIDMPICFILGCLVGFLQLYLAPANELYANVFEITAAVATSFLARVFGSIRNGRLFCFSSLAQASIALILPGWLVLCASLELQNRQIISGAVRMVYSLIYTLFLGYGFTIGSILYGYMDKHAVSDIHCSSGDTWYTKRPPENFYLLFVFPFTICLCAINQAKWKQIPVQVLIALAGFSVNHFSGRFFKGNGIISSSLGTLTVGLLANLYSRLGRYCENFFLDLWEFHIEPRLSRLFLRHRCSSAAPYYTAAATSSEHTLHTGKERVPDPELGAAIPTSTAPNTRPSSATGSNRKRKIGYGLAATAMLPGIFVQVPSGLASTGSLLSGVTSADQIVRNETILGNGTIVNGTVGPVPVAVPSSSSTGSMTGMGSSMAGDPTASLAATISQSGQLNNSAFNVLFSVIQVAINLSVGLSLSALLVYPFGKRRSGLFSF